MRTWTNYLSDYTNFTSNTSTANSALGGRMVNDAIRYLVGIFFFNEATYIVPGGTVSNQAGYQLPFDVKQVINITVSIGSVLWQPKECATRKQYDALNVIPFDNDFPQYYYIYNDQALIWPIPASANNVITINYKKRITDLSVADYVTGTVSVTQNATAVTGSGTAWTTNMAGSWLNIAVSSSNTTSGDNAWYQIASVQSATALTLMYQGQTVAGGAYIIGNVSLIPEDFQDLPLYRACYLYHASIKENKAKADMYMELYESGYKALDAEFGSKTSGVGLTSGEMSVINPNFYQNNITQI